MEAWHEAIAEVGMLGSSKANILPIHMYMYMQLLHVHVLVLSFL